MDVQSNTWFVIINPAAGVGQSLKIWSKLKPLLDEANIDFQFAQTKHRGHAIELVKNIVRSGGSKILAIGGDGTANEVINGLFLSGVDTSKIVFGLVSSGSGNDWVRTVGRHGSPAQIARSLKATDSVNYDVGVIRYASGDSHSKRYFLNIVGAGFDGAVVYKMHINGRSESSRMIYWKALIAAIFSYKSTMVKLSVDGEHFSFNTLSLAIGIGKYNGGGMKQLPFADYNDGKLDVTVISDMSKWKMIWNLPRLSNGNFTKLEQVKTFQGREITLDGDSPIHVEADGEFVGSSPFNVSILPSAIQILKWK
jgi:YegS/Rv2252/BmrU family lipid kinase